MGDINGTRTVYYRPSSNWTGNQTKVETCEKISSVMSEWVIVV
jgi:hypothetical protein